jgi:hypothetical protein
MATGAAYNPNRNMTYGGNQQTSTVPGTPQFEQLMGGKTGQGRWTMNGVEVDQFGQPIQPAARNTNQLYTASAPGWTPPPSSLPTENRGVPAINTQAIQTSGTIAVGDTNPQPTNPNEFLNQLGLGGLIGSAKTGIENLLNGLPSVDQARTENAYFGARSGMPGSDFVRNRGYDLYGQKADAYRQSGLNNLNNLISTVANPSLTYAGQQQQNRQFGQSLAEQVAQRLQQGSQFGMSLAEQQAQRQQQGSQFGQTLAQQIAQMQQQNSQFTQSQQQQQNQFNQNLGQQGGQFNQDLELRQFLAQLQAMGMGATTVGGRTQLPNMG